jgi:HlyD family secretion protein
MVISDLSRMEARVDIGEMDIVLLQPGQKAQLEVDSFKDKKFTGIVTDVASSSEGMNSAASALGGSSSSSSGGTATQFEVRIRVQEADAFRPGMSVSATVETRSRTNVLAAPIASVTTRTLKDKTQANGKPTGTNSPATNSPSTNAQASSGSATNQVKDGKKSGDNAKPTDVVFVVEGDHVKTVPVKIGISDDNFYEITDGLKEGDEIVTGGYHAISRDLDDGKKILKGTVAPEPDKPKP